MTWLTVRALLAKVPGMVWVALFVLAFLVAGGYAMYHNGQAAGVKQERRKTLAVETPKAIARVDTAHAHSETVVHVAEKARGVSDSTRAEREAVRTAALQELCGDPRLPRIQQLVTLDDSLSRRDSVTIAVQAGAIDTLKAEIAARSHLDSVRVETIAVGQPEPDHHTVLKIAGGVFVGVVGVLTLIHFAR